jgi:hypothetical protein
MNNFHHAYSRHSAEELEALRAPAREAPLAEFHRKQLEGHRNDTYRRVENLKVLCAELVDLLDLVEADEKGRSTAELGSLGRHLRFAENELLAATGALADQLGLVAMAQTT